MVHELDQRSTTYGGGSLTGSLIRALMLRISSMLNKYRGYLEPMVSLVTTGSPEVESNVPLNEGNN